MNLRKAIKGFSPKSEHIDVSHSTMLTFASLGPFFLVGPFLVTQSLTTSLVITSLGAVLWFPLQFGLLVKKTKQLIKADRRRAYNLIDNVSNDAFSAMSKGAILTGLIFVIYVIPLTLARAEAVWTAVSVLYPLTLILSRFVLIKANRAADELMSDAD